MEQVGTAFVQVIPSMRGFHQTIARDLRRNMGQVGEESGKTFTQRMFGSVNQGMGKLGGAISRTTRDIARAAMSIRPVDLAVRGLQAGIRGTHLATTGMAGALTSMGQRAQTAITMARNGARNLVAGFQDSRAAASAFTGVLGTIGGLARSAVQPVITGAQNLVAGFMDSDAAASAFTGRLGTLGGLARRAVQPVADGARNLVAGFLDSDAAASAFTGRLGTLGGLARSAIQPVVTGTQNLVAGLQSADAAASAFTGIMGTIGGAPRAAVDAITESIGRFVDGFGDANAAASAFSGFMGTLGGAAATVVRPLQVAVDGVATGFTRVRDTAQTALGHAQDQARLLSAGMRNVGVSASEAGTGVYRFGTHLQGTYRAAQSVTGAATAGFHAVGSAAQAAAGAATSGFHAVGRGLQAATAPVAGLASGLRGTISEATGLTGAMNTAGYAVNTAFTHGAKSVSLFASGLRGVGVSASESNSWMYRLGQTTTSTVSGIGSGFRSAGEAITSAGSRVREWAQETTSQVGGLGSAFTRMGAMGAAAIGAIGMGALASQVTQVAMSAATTEAQLTALYGAAGGGAAEVTAVMEGMNEKFRGLDMNVMRQGAVSLAYMGLQGEEAVGVLERLEKATTATGSGAIGMDRAFAALTKGVNAGKFQMVELNQISDAGIPIYDALSDVLGVSIPEAQAMASAGAIGLSEVLDALSGDYGVWFPALLEGADNIGNTFSGAWSTIQSTIVNGFANELVPLFDAAAPLMARFAKRVDEGFTKLPGLLERVKRFLVDSGIVDAVTRFVNGVKSFASEATPAVRTFAETLSEYLGVAISGVLLALGPLGDAFEKAAEWMAENQELVELLGAALGGAAAAIVAVYVAKGIWATVTWGLAAALNATGIPLLIFAIAALVAGVIYAYKNFDGFRETVDKVAGAVKTAALWIWDNGLKPAFDGIVAGAKAVGEWCVALWDDYLQPAFEAIADAGMWIWDNGLKPAFDGIVAGAKEVGEWASWLGDHLSTAWETLSGFFSDPPTFAEIGESLKQVGTDVTSWLGEKGTELLSWFKSLPGMARDALVEAGQTALDWLVETFHPTELKQFGQDIAAHIIDGLETLGAGVKARAEEAGEAIKEWAQQFPEQVRERVSEIGEAFLSWAQDLPDKVRDRVSEVGEAAISWAQGLPDRVRERLGEVLDGIVEWAKSVPDTIKEWIDTGAAAEWVLGLKDTVVERLSEVVDAVVEWGKSLPDKIKSAIDNAARIQEWITEWGPKILLGLVGALLVVVLAIPTLLAGIAAVVLYVLGVILWELGKWLWDKFTELMVSVGEAIAAKVTEVTDKFRQIRDGAVQWVQNLHDRVLEFFTNLRESASARVNALRDRVTLAFTQVRDWVVQRATALRDRALAAFTNARDRAVTTFGNLRDRATEIMGNARDWIASRAERLRDRVVTPIEKLRDKVIEAFDKARAGIKTAWEKVEEITRKPVAFVVNTVYNDGIRGVWNKVADLVDMDTLPKIYGFASGGILPGYTPGRDVHTFLSPTGGGLELSGGEAIMRPEWTRAVGPGFVDSMNRVARTGGVQGVKSALGFARGGIFPTQRFNRGGIFDRVASFGSTLKDIFTGDGLKSAARAVLDPLIETMRGRFSGGRWNEALVGVPGAIFTKLTDWFKTVIGPKLGGDGKKVADIASSYVGVSGNPNQFTRAFGMNGQPWCAMFVSEVIKEAKAQKAYNNIRSAAVASFANSSLESIYSSQQTRPGDLAVYRGKGPGNWGHINIITDTKGGTVGGNESNRVRSSTSYSSRASKFMRPKFATGGIWQQDREWTRDALTHPLTRLLRAGEDANLFDSGGWLMPGWNAVQNATGRPEAVLTPSQSDALVRLASRRRSSEGHVFNVYETQSARVTARSTVNALRDYETLHPTP